MTALKAEPDIASVSDMKSKWMSGFDEPSREPDYYERVITLPSLEKDRPARLIFRRPIKLQTNQAHFSAQDFEHSFEVRAERCRLTTHDISQQFPTLMLKMATLSKWRYSGSDSPPLPIRENPDAPLPPLNPFEIEATLEVRCQDASCQKILVQQLEARKGAP